MSLVLEKIKGELSDKLNIDLNNIYLTWKTEYKDSDLCINAPGECFIRPGIFIQSDCLVQKYHPSSIEYFFGYDNVKIPNKSTTGFCIYFPFLLDYMERNDRCPEISDDSLEVLKNYIHNNLKLNIL